ncbi:hypothetical protein PBT90_12255 [Algoriphagus halophytocola]|uniref:Uncharacterized protein n=1 Tax=Algoriphagus halophytocola TaxID=2991499 RepID=A0ABY6MK51_9BACT|nr:MULTISPECIES: hypothetical protein [unclassified Algoriphagus]UZD24156.1 hypothetical protein OM944_06565 [Algoriphagus sp. TR-M5]WBL41527.1 hypothetical protein PBT90_12255 [Algoriphagus sp. TR-M9]
MKKLLFWVCGLIFLTFSVHAKQEARLFDNEEILDVNMGFSVKNLRKFTNDSTYMDSFFAYKNSSGSMDSLEVELRVRGNFRLQNCFYPPLRMKIKKKKAKGTILQGNRKLKIVFPCAKNSNADSFVAKEFACYQMYELVNQHYFRTRLVRINFLNEDDKKGEPVQLLGFLVEDDDEVAKRFDAEILENTRVIGTLLEDSSAVRHDYFQFMIGNTDWSSLNQHNMKILRLKDDSVIPLAYDFDMTGLVMPPYSQVSNLLEISSVKERLYRGYCREEPMMQAIRQEYLANEKQLLEAVNDLQPLINEREIDNMHAFLNEFFDILKDDNRFAINILSACRTVN